MNTSPSGAATAHLNLYKALLQNEFSIFSFSEAVLNLIEALERKEEQRGLSSQQLADAYRYACSLLSFITETQKLLEQKKRLVKSEYQLYEDTEDIRFA